MTTIMSVPPIWAFDRDDPEMRAALAAGWRRRDLWWERLQERGNLALLEGREADAVRYLRRAHWIACLGFEATDPRQATSTANAAFAARLRGSEKLAERRYVEARELWKAVPSRLPALQIKPRAKSSLFHLRMEVRHWETYRQNMTVRLGRFVEETGDALRALSRGDPPPHRLFSRWRGEKPAVFDDTRRLLAACLLVASPKEA